MTTDLLDTALTTLAPSGLEKRLGYMLRLAQKRLSGQLAEAFRPYNIRPSQYAMMLVIEANPGLKQQEVGHSLALRHSNLVALFSDLEQRGFIRRGLAPGDRRSRALSLTAAGIDLLAKLRAAEASRSQEIRRRLTAEEEAQMLVWLRRLAE